MSKIAIAVVLIIILLSIVQWVLDNRRRRLEKDGWVKEDDSEHGKVGVTYYLPKTLCEHTIHYRDAPPMASAYILNVEIESPDGQVCYNILRATAYTRYGASELLAKTVTALEQGKDFPEGDVCCEKEKRGTRANAWGTNP